jgi:hypothetical protein
MQVSRSPRFLIASTLAAAAHLAACGGESRAPYSYALESVAEPIRDEAPYVLGPGDSCHWLEDGRLFVEIVWGTHAIGGVERNWIEFQPPLEARVEIASWNEETSSGARWPRKDFRGSAWVSSDGMGLGQPGGPDLVVDTEWTCWISGSDQSGGRRLLVSAERLERALEGARPPGVIALTSSPRSLLEIEAEPLKKGDTCRWLESGELFVETVRGSNVLRFWVAFDAPHLPRVRAAGWNGDRERRPAGWGYLRAGRAWVSSRGDGVGSPEGPDVILEADLLGPFAVDIGRRHVALLLDDSALRRSR